MSKHNSKIIPLGKIKITHSSYDSGFNSDAVIYIPEEILRKNPNKGLTLYLHSFFIAKDILLFRSPSQHKIAIFSTVDSVHIGKKDYLAPYVKTEIILQETDLEKVVRLIQQQEKKRPVKLGDFV